MFEDYCVYAGSYFLSVLSAVNPAIAALKRPKALPREIGLQPIQLSISKKGQYASPAWGDVNIILPVASAIVNANHGMM